MRRTVVNWKQLNKVLMDSAFCKTIERICFDEDRLESLTFSTWDDAPQEVEE
jgi:hypothetical protein